MKNKSAKIEFKLDEELFLKYKELCERKGHTMSKKLRGFIEKEIKIDEELKLIETDITEYINDIMWEFNTPEFRKSIKDDVDKIMDKHLKNGIVYNYITKCDEENNTK